MTLISFCSGCSTIPIVQVGSDIAERNSKIEETVSLKNKNVDLLNIAAQTGKSLGYKIEETTSNGIRYGITLRKATSMLAKALTPLSQYVYIDILEIPEGLKIKVDVTGSWGAGTKESAAKILDEFKEKLLVKIE